MSSALGSLGSSTCTTWNRRVRAGSFSMYFLYSPQVVAAMVLNVPRASAGFRRLAASPVPAAPPAPLNVWASSMKRMIGAGGAAGAGDARSEEHTSELQSPAPLLCPLLLDKKKL